VRAHVAGMTISTDKLADLRTKHLEMLQAVVARMATYGATLKNYCITITTAVCGFAVTLQRPAAALVGLVPVMICAVLDARYLQNERRFRALFDQVRQEEWTGPPSFAVDLRSTPPVPMREILISWSIAIFYGGLALLLLIIFAIGWRVHGRLA
jgi:hypothetical protein